MPDIETFAALGRATGVAAFMNTPWGWPWIESLHFLGLSVLLGTIGLFDLRILGAARALPIRALHRLAPIGAAGFALSALTGSLFLMTAPDQYLFNPAFKLKLFCLAFAGLNVLAFYILYGRRLSSSEPLGEPDWRVKTVACLSLATWAGVIILGRVITLYRPPYHWCVFCNG